MRRPIVAGNWKLHGSRAENARLVEEIMAQVPSKPAGQCIVCPPVVYLQEVGRLLRGSSVELGAQNVCAETQGAFTGEVSAAMLKDVGAEYVIVGHSERRLIYRESDQLVARKFQAAQSKSLVPILCLGEQLAERDADRTKDVIARQLDAVLELVGIDAFAHAVIAYEPVWAIGTGRTPGLDDIAEVHAHIRNGLDARFGRAGRAVRILYGGSMKPDNATAILKVAEVNGGLVGGASLKSADFLAILRAAAGPG
jgi:triosephosphate isomerase (TIM)